jgi:hypothetical protein
MSLRDTLNKNPAVVLGAMAALLVAVLGWFFLTGGGSGASGTTSPTWYTVDDGATYFADNPADPPPVETSRGLAVRAIVAKDAETGEEFVHHLVKYSPEHREQLLQARATGDFSMLPPRLVKRPGDAEWLSTGDPAQSQAASAITAPGRSPAGNRVSFVNPG